MEKSRWERSERREHVVQQERVQRTEHYSQMMSQQGKMIFFLDFFPLAKRYLT